MPDSSDTKFDPLHKWLGIPPSEQPPDHYRLLGLAQFESDPDVIAAAGDRQMAHIKSFALGRHAIASQECLNRLAQARVCLLNEKMKADYDAVLRDALESVATTAAAPPPAPAPASPMVDESSTTWVTIDPTEPTTPASRAAYINSLPEAEPIVSSGRSKISRRLKKNRGPSIAAVVFVAFFVVSIILLGVLIHLNSQ